MKKITFFLSLIVLGASTLFPAWADNCGQAVLSPEMTLHIPYIQYNEMTLTADLGLTDSGLFEILSVDTTQIPMDCARAVLSGDLALHIPTIIFGESALWADLTYTETGMFQVTAYGFLDDGAEMSLTSPAFENEGFIPARYSCDDLNISPELNIKGVPAQAESLVLIVDDPDAPSGTWTHWTVWNIARDTSTIPENAPMERAIEGMTDFGTTGYGGPCPPEGVHRYFFKLFALDRMLDLSPGAVSGDIQEAMSGHILSEAVLMGRYQRQ